MYTGNDLKSLEHNGLSWSYALHGKGTHALVALHGFGQNSEAFNFLIPHLDEMNVQLISVNLFHHGGNALNNKRTTHEPATQREMALFFRHFLNSLNLTKVNAIGYSLGGRVLLSLLQECPDVFSNVLFVAPDGFTKNIYYQFATQNPLGRWISAKTNANPKPLISFAKGLHKTKLLPSYALKLAQMHLGDEENRNQVYAAWMSHRKLNPSPKKAGEAALLNDVNCGIIFGKYDKVIPAIEASRLTPHFGEYLFWMVLEKGHLLLGEALVVHIQDFLQNPEHFSHSS